MDAQGQYNDSLDLSTHSNDQSYSQHPNTYQRNFASQPRFMQDDYSIRNSNRFPSGPSSMPGQSYNANGDLDQYLNFESTPTRPDQIKTPSNINQKSSFESNRETQSSFIPQNNPNKPFQSQTFTQSNEKNMGMPSGAGLQELFMNNMNNPIFLHQFTQFMQAMNQQGRSMPPFPNAGFNPDMQRNFAMPNMPFNMPQYNFQNPQLNQNIQQKQDFDDGGALPSASELITGDFNSSKLPKASQNDFDSGMKLNKSGESQLQTDEFENIEKNLDNFSLAANIPLGKKKENNDRPIKASQQEDFEKPEQQETNPFDDVKVKGGTSKRFEDLLEEQLRQNPDAIKKGPAKGAGPKKEFLKRGSGLNATHNPHKDKNVFNEEKENLGYNNESNFLSNDRKYKADTERNTNNPLTVRHMNENNVLQDQNLFSDRQSVPGKKNQNENMFGKYSSFGEKPEQKSNKVGIQAKKQANAPLQAKKNLENKYTPQHKQYEEKEDNGDSEGQNIQFDDPEEWRSPDKKKYNLEKYTSEAPVTFGTQEAEARDRSESPVYHFDDEFEADHKAKIFDKRNYETKKKEEPAKEKGKFFWERGSEDIAPKQSEPQEKKKIMSVEQEKKTEVYMDPRLQALEKEIKKFRAENERVESERKEWKETLEKLEREKEEWENLKDNERREIDEWKQEESKKIKKERKIIAESHQNMYKNVAGRKEREEIENLKKQLEELKEEMNTKDKRAKTNLEKLKKKLDDENQKTVELKQELKYYEEMRIKGNDPRNPRQSQAHKPNVQPGRDKQEQNIKKELPKVSQKKMREESESEEEEDVIHEEDEEDSGDERNQRYRHNQKRHGHGESELKYEDIIKDPRKPGNFRDHGKPAEKASKTPSKVAEEKKGVQIRGGMEKREVMAQNFKAIESDDEVEEYDEYPDSNRNPRFKERKSFSQDAYLFNTNAYFQKYLARNRPNRVSKEVMFDDGKVQIQRIYEDGRREDVFFNGVRRLTFPDGYNIIYFINKDIRQTLPDSTVIYYYAEAQTTQTKLPNGECIYRFNKDDNNQVEFHFPDESKDIYFPDGSRKLVFPNQEEETSFPDGTVTKVNAHKVKFTYYPDKTKEVFYPDGLKIRTYPDGRTKKFFPDGSVEIS